MKHVIYRVYSQILSARLAGIGGPGAVKILKQISKLGYSSFLFLCVSDIK
jgi:hypothetical protein